MSENIMDSNLIIIDDDDDLRETYYDLLISEGFSNTLGINSPFISGQVG